MPSTISQLLVKVDAEPELPGVNAQSWLLPEFSSPPQPLGVFEFNLSALALAVYVTGVSSLRPASLEGFFKESCGSTNTKLFCVMTEW